MTLKDYQAKRALLLQQNDFAVTLPLDPQEQRLNAKLCQLRDDYTAAEINRIYSTPLYLCKDTLQTEPLFHLLRDMPKGANLHIHSLACIPPEQLLSLALESPHTFVSIDPNPSRFGALSHCPDGNTPAADLLPLKTALSQGRVTETSLLDAWTLCPANAHINDRWSVFGPIFGKLAPFVDGDRQIFIRFYTAAMEECIQDNIFHMELRIELPSFDPKDSSGLSGALALREAYYNVKTRHPSFTLKLIDIDSKRTCLPHQVEQGVRDMLHIRASVPDLSDPADPTPFVLGYDLVEEEDKGQPLSVYAPYFLSLREQGASFDLYLHAGESLSYRFNNLSDAFLLGSRRIGHGFALYRYPRLLEDVTAAGIPLEVCPISNQLLGYCTDLRLHPALSYMKRGVPMVLCSDDPLMFGNQGLTCDFFAAVTAWGLGLGEIKALCLNSLYFAGLSSRERHAHLLRFHDDWRTFVQSHL